MAALTSTHEQYWITWNGALTQKMCYGIVKRTFMSIRMTQWDLISGAETTSDGTTIVYGANWEVTSSTVSVTGMTALTTLELEGLPTPLKAASGDTFAKVSDWGQVTYLDAAGNILGYYDSWSDGDYSGESYMDANWNSSWRQV